MDVAQHYRTGCALNIVLAIEAINPPLTGVGRYAWELATRLPLHAEVESVRYLSDGLWRDLPDLGQEVDLPGTGTKAKDVSLSARLRHRLGRSSMASKVYGKILPYIAKKRLQGLSDGVFHGPNYLLPETALKKVLTVHDLSVFRFPQWHPKARIARARQSIPASVFRADLVITDSLATRLEVMAEFDLAPQNIIAIPLGVDAQFHPRSDVELQAILARFGLQQGEYTFFVSTIEPRKNLSRLMAAYRGLPPALRQRFPLVLVGDHGWQSANIHAEIELASGEGWLTYLGYVEQCYIPFLYAGCRLFAYPSLYEGFGLPIAEAMASGVPVLTSNCSSMPEVAAGAALLVEPADVVSIRTGLLQALEDENWRTIAIAKGLQRAAELSWDACLQRTVAAYRMVQES
jgi:glycosyltransferase involved in cell wall biosynthesis